MAPCIKTYDQQEEKLREFIFGEGTKPAPAKPAQAPPTPPKVFRPPSEAAAIPAPTKPPVLTPGKSTVHPPLVPDKSKATFVGKVGEEKMSFGRKACVEKCASGQARCNNICEQAQKTNDAMMKIDCQNCLQTITSCVNRCPAK